MALRRPRSVVEEEEAALEERSFGADARAAEEDTLVEPEPEPQAEPVRPSDPAADPAQGNEGGSWGNHLTNELVKAYGWHRSAEGDWSWSVDTAIQAFRDDPVWTTIDWLSVAVPFAKWGTAARQIAKGGKSIAGAYQAGEYAGKAATSVPGQVIDIAERVFKPSAREAGGGSGLGAAAEHYVRSGSLAGRQEGRVFEVAGKKASVEQGREFFESKSSPVIDERYQDAMRAYGYDPAEARGLNVMLDRERRLEMEATRRMAQESLGAIERANLTPDQERIFTEALERGEVPFSRGGVEGAAHGGRTSLRDERGFIFTDTASTTQERMLREANPLKGTELEIHPRTLNLSPERVTLSEALGVDGFRAYRSHHELRNRVHVKLFTTGMIPQETFLKFISKEDPGLFDEIAQAAGGGKEALEEYIQKKGGVGELPVTYEPRMYEEFLPSERAGATAVAGEPSVKAAERAGADRLKSRTSEGPNPDLTRLLDPRVGVVELAKAHTMAHNQEYFIKLAGSAVSRPPSEVAEHALKLVREADPKKLALYNITPEIAAEIARLAEPVVRSVPKGKSALADALIENGAYLPGQRADIMRKPLAEVQDEVLGRLGTSFLDDVAEESVEDSESIQTAIGRLLGWRKQEDFGALPEHWSRLPEELKGRMLDPNVAEDFQGLFAIAKHLEDANFAARATRAVWSGYQHGLGTFRATKTAYSPPTFVRNAFGAMVNHHFAVGGRGLFDKRGLGAPLVGLKEYRKGMDSKWFKAGAEHGHLGGSFTVEVKESLDKAVNSFEGLGKRATALDWMGDSDIAKFIQKGAGWAEDMYRSIDEVYKLDAFIRISERHVAAGMDEAEAMARATTDINRFMPVFSQPSELTKIVRNVVPFSSFLTESLRTWKNTMIEKPHLAFFWTHFAEGAGAAIGYMNGYTPEEIDDLKGSLPYFTEGRKMMLWPFTVEGKPAFIDMSYLIPLASIAETGDVSAHFFDMALIDPTTNPVLNFVAAGATGVDPFSRREIEPRFAERQLGMEIEGPKARHLVGLLEHTATMMMPPLLPPGYGFTNLSEMVRGQKHPGTGAELEGNLWQTLGANVFGARLYQADVNSQLLNVRHEEKLTNDSISQWWNRWEYAKANGDRDSMDVSEKNIVDMYDKLGREDIDGTSYFLKNKDKHEPGEFRTVSTRHMNEVLQRASKMGHFGPEDLKMIGELHDRLKERKSRKGGKKKE